MLLPDQVNIRACSLGAVLPSGRKRSPTRCKKIPDAQVTSGMPVPGVTTHGGGAGNPTVTTNRDEMLVLSQRSRRFKIPAAANSPDPSKAKLDGSGVPEMISPLDSGPWVDVPGCRKT